MVDFITLTCPSCGGKVKVRSDARSYICEFCGNEHLLTTPFINQSPKDLDRPDAPQPECITYEQDGKVLKIHRRWFSLRYVPLAFFCVAWDAFLVFWYAMALGTEGAPWIMIVFPIAHVAVGVALTYSTLAGFINHTDLEVTLDKLTTHHGPLPWTGQMSFPTKEITQFYTRHNKGNRGAFSYDLFMITRDGKTRKVLFGLESPDIPLFIEQHIERWLNIKDESVAGELPRE